MDEPSSFNSVAEKWHPEVTHYRKNVPTVLAATKIDLRNDKEVTERLAKVGKKTITEEEVGFPLNIVSIDTIAF